MALDGTSYIFLDDADASITYTGSWIPNAWSGILETSHKLIATSAVSGFSVNFTGTSIVAVAGTANQNDTQTTMMQNLPVYTVHCKLDGGAVFSESFAQAISGPSGTRLCQSTKVLSAGTTHTLDVTLEFGSPSPDFSFYLDYLLVEPAPNQKLGAEQDALIFAGDPAIVKIFNAADAGWTQRNNSWETSETGSQFTFNFTGVAVQWFGVDSPFPSLESAKASYTIDGGDPFTFEMTKNANPGCLFMTQPYPYGPHTLQVMYLGTNNSVPLTLSSLVVQRVPSSGEIDLAPVSSTTPSVSPTLASVQLLPSASPSATHASSHSIGTNHLAAIIGGIIAFLVVVTGAVVVFIFFRRRRRLARGRQLSLLAPSDDFSNADLISPFPLVTSPRTTEPERPVIAGRASKLAFLNKIARLGSMGGVRRDTRDTVGYHEIGEGVSSIRPARRNNTLPPYSA